jgi:hypothetical protein
MKNCSVCSTKNSNHCCSLCFIPFCGLPCFNQHQLICAGTKRTKEGSDVSEKKTHSTTKKVKSTNQIIEWIQENNVRKIQQLIETNTMPVELISLRYARSLEMAQLLKADPFEYIGDGKIALDECAKWFNIRPFLPRSKDELVVVCVDKLKLLKDAYFNTDKNRGRFGIQFITNPALKTDLNEIDNMIKTIGSGDYDAVKITIGGDLKYEELFTHMIYNCFYPAQGHRLFDSSDEFDMFIENKYLKRFDNNTLNFWFGRDHIDNINNWYYYNFEEMDRRIEREPRSFMLFLNGRYNKIFKESRRAKTMMETFRTVDSKTVKERPSEDTMIPITRYATGMSSGLYYNETKETHYCGTFYYYEPESTVFLKYNRMLKAKDKKEAADILGINLEDYESLTGFILDKLISKGENPSLMFTPKELHIFLNEIEMIDSSDSFGDIKFTGKEQKLPPIKYYCGHVLNVYAEQDFLDQPLCRAASEQGYDVILLTHMVGSRQVVSEVLDTRPRMESFDNLYYLQE